MVAFPDILEGRPHPGLAAAANHEQNRLIRAARLAMQRGQRDCGLGHHAPGQLQCLEIFDRAVPAIHRHTGGEERSLDAAAFGDVEAEILIDRAHRPVGFLNVFSWREHADGMGGAHKPIAGLKLAHHIAPILGFFSERWIDFRHRAFSRADRRGKLGRRIGIRKICAAKAEGHAGEH